MKKLHAFIFLITTVLFTNSCKNSNVDEINSNSKSKSDSVVKTKPDSLNTIETVKIGTQIWTAKNLDVFTYQNGDTITEVKNINTLKNIKTGAWCYYNFDAKNGKKYGKLYNFAAVKDPRGIAPKGFHIPTVLEYHWYNNPTLNEKGFNAFPAGSLSISRYPYDRNPFFKELGGLAFFACQDNRFIFFECEQCKIKFDFESQDRAFYLSVRCIKD